MRHVARPAAAVFAVALAFVSGCSDGSSTGPKNESALTAQEAQLVAAAVMTEVSRAMSTAGSRRTDLAASTSVRPTETYSSTCTNGGTISGSFTYTDTFTSTGTGSFSGTMTVAPQGCKVSTGTRLIAVGGSWTFTFNFNYANYAQVGDATWRGTGAFTWEGGNCTIDYTMRINASGRGGLTGTFCGVSLNTNL